MPVDQEWGGTQPEILRWFSTINDWVKNIVSLGGVVIYIFNFFLAHVMCVSRVAVGRYGAVSKAPRPVA